MIDFYTWTTPNGRKVSLMLEECGLPYRVHKVDIGKGEQFRPEFLAINPNNRIPAIVDTEGPEGKPLALFESGAILVYLAGKTGRFLPASTTGKYIALQWLMFQMGGVGPMFGQAHHFLRAAPEPVPYGIKRYTDETRRLYGVLDKRLAGRDFIVGKDYTIADMAAYPWIIPERQGQDLAQFPNLARWHAAIRARPATARAYARAKEINPAPRGPVTEQERKVLFGQDRSVLK